MLKKFLMTGLMVCLCAVGIRAEEPALPADFFPEETEETGRDAPPDAPLKEDFTGVLPGGEAALKEEYPGLLSGSTQETFVMEIIIPEKVAEGEASSAAPRAERPASQIIPEVNFEQSSIQEAMRIVSERSGVRIEGADALEGTVTLCLRNIPFEQLLFLLAKLSDGAFVFEGRDVRVLPSGEYESKYGQPFAPETEVAVMKLRYRTVKDIKENLEQLESLKGHLFMDEKNQQVVVLDRQEPLGQMIDMLKSWDMPPLVTKTFFVGKADLKASAEKLSAVLTEGVGALAVNEETRELTVKDLAANFTKIEAFFQTLTKAPEIVWRLQMSRIQLNEEHQDGIDWEAIVSEYQKADVLGYRAGLPPENNHLSVGTITKEDLPVLKDALDAAGQLIDLYDMTGTADLNHETTFIVDTASNAKSFKDPEGMAMTIKVRLKNADKERVLVRVSPELTWLADNAPAIHSSAPDNFIPQESLEVSLKKQDVIVLGGLLREKELERTSKVPLLGDLPFLGFIFRSENRLILRTEYIIFLIPDRPASP
ncbi:MAG: hypothetical protein KBB26_04070 [Candidatus Omnitrophica bacterium]|nr:hypothetical protein [Candidatus Omnitrophota bacterium]